MSLNESTLSSLFAPGPPPKRKRMSHLESLIDNSQQQVSVIKDTRVVPSQAVRLNSGMIKVQVGPAMDSEDLQSTRETFYVHESAICDASPYFANAMKPEWSNLRPDPRTIELPEDDPAAFELYMSFLYAKQLPILSVPSEAATTAAANSSWEPESDGYHTLAYAYVLGDRLLDIKFKNAIVDAYVLYARGTQPAKRYYPSTEEIRILYEGTREEAPIRQLLVDIWTARGKSDWLEADADLPREFLAQVTKGLLKSREKATGIGAAEGLSRPWKLSHEQYHEK
ncbi:hypothetical protein BU24DRAFT_421440 [Aaosphaeria arxii CBS 175.79]|uniref:BTB domain-containing protein n=1 Tax=Aaosphaeria arxii CBS 175.79 TaxID=1450172 RepID=A0A6A5XZ35_9PLEO|nr:uncharacterized protein BU24DRAFT_421440 [Aaosphaeria arxii CBS 175.79]KAF2018452.1 hypothetical protein BU24DRAFT_421440 [Aaosphaeria arxii CBS 175.79]